MNTVTYVFGIVAALLALAAIVELLRRSTLRERHAVWWLVGGVLALVVAVFPQTLTWAARLLGVAVPANLVFFLAIGLLFLVSLQYGAELTRIEDKMRALAESTAFHDERLRRLEEDRADAGDGADAADAGDARDAGDAADAGDALDGSDERP
ncbi:DUF2304 domain-containing protein [Microbacterium sp. No. 7]|uniref:DUF2304 domain-containing protein n=1 Tax=Microbacterium sp. No. 7 TaxID=1714373 RepID=UPI0006ECEB3B|nr:DUF2304 domain-containing protein [Microbacterium sp. No. 7]ALJ19379.1 hypothetical protein AOA12_05455 [Microbacterium sp. No. 7]